MASAKRGDGLKPATRIAFLTAQPTPGQTLHDSARASTTIRWGLGIGLYQTRDEQLIWHWGDNGAFRGFACLSLTHQRGYVYFTNSRNGLSLLSALSMRVLGQPDQAITSFLGYDQYRSPLIQVGRQLISEDVATVVRPYLPVRGQRLAYRPAQQLTEPELTALASELQEAGQYERAATLLSEGLAHHPPASSLYKAYWEAWLRAGNQANAVHGLRAYLARNPLDSSAQQILHQLSQPARGNVTLQVKGFTNARLITLAGSFNHWQPLHTIFRHTADGWRCQLQLPPGHYTYRLLVDGHWQTDPANTVTEADENGTLNSVLEVQASP